MATPANLVQLAFAAGLDESQQTEILDPLRGFALLENGRQDKRGGYTKRLGFTALSTLRLSGEREAGNRLLSHRGTPCVIDGEEFDVYSEGLSRSVVASRVPEVGVTTRSLVCVDNPDRIQSIHVNNGYIITASFADPVETANDPISYLRVGVETVDGQLIREPETLEPSTWGDTDRSADVAAEICSHGTLVYVLLREPLKSDIWLWTLDTSSAATVAAGWVEAGVIGDEAATDPGATAGKTFAAASGTDACYMAYVSVDDSIQVHRLVNGVSATIAFVTPAQAPRALAIGVQTGDTLWLAWDEPGVQVQALNPSTLATTGTKAALYANVGSPLFLQVLPTATGAGRVLFNVAADDMTRSREFEVTGGAVVADDTFDVDGLWLRSHAAERGDRIFGLVTGPTTSGLQTILADLTPATGVTTVRPVASVFPGLTKTTERPIRPAQVTDDKVAWPVLVQRSAVHYSAELVVFDFADATRWRSVEHNNSLVMSGGLLSYFDGERVAEVGILYRPNKPELTYDPPGTDGNSYRYVATYEEVDAAGNWTVSEISDPSDLVTLDEVAPSVTVSVYGLAVTARKRVRVAYYRTLNGGEPPYYYLASAANTTEGFAEYVDDLTVDDTELATRRKLYAPNLATGGGEPLSREAPPHCQDVESFAGMLVIASGRDLRWSAQSVVGEGTWFSSIFQQPVDEADLTALAAQDGTLYAFTRRRIYAVAGEAPSDNGAVGGLGAPRRLAADVGCIDPRSVVVTSGGIFFQSERGIELLNRGGSVQWIGEPVQETLATYPVVSNATLDAKHGLVRFTLAPSTTGGRVTGSGRSLVFDLTLGAWISRDTFADETAGQDAAVVYLDGAWRYAWLSAAGTVRYENVPTDATAYLDDGAEWVTMTAETAWFKVSGLQGVQHFNSVTLLERRHTDHHATVSLAYNYEEAWRSPRRWTSAAINEVLDGGWPITQLKHAPHEDAKCQAIRIRVQDLEPSATDDDPAGETGSGKGATWLGLTLDITPKPGVFDVPEEAR